MTMVLIRDPTLESQCRCSPDDQELGQIEQVGKNAGVKQRVQDTRAISVKSGIVSMNGMLTRRRPATQALG